MATIDHDAFFIDGDWRTAQTDDRSTSSRRGPSR